MVPSKATLVIKSLVDGCSEAIIGQKIISYVVTWIFTYFNNGIARTQTSFLPNPSVKYLFFNNQKIEIDHYTPHNIKEIIFSWSETYFYWYHINYYAFRTWKMGYRGPSPLLLPNKFTIKYASLLENS